MNKDANLEQAEQEYAPKAYTEQLRKQQQFG
jgi:hypothetical protein